MGAGAPVGHTIRPERTKKALIETDASAGNENTANPGRGVTRSRAAAARPTEQARFAHREKCGLCKAKAIGISNRQVSNPTRHLNISTSTGQRKPTRLLVSCRKKKGQGALDGKLMMRDARQSGRWGGEPSSQATYPRMPGAAMSLSFAEDHGKVGDSHHPYLFVSLSWWLGCWGWATPSSPSQTEYQRQTSDHQIFDGEDAARKSS